MDKADAQDPAAVLSEAAEKAYMCYQRSEAEAAAHQSTARPGTEQAATAPQEVCAGHSVTLSEYSM